MHRLFSVTLPLLAAVGAGDALPTIPILNGPGPDGDGIVATTDGTLYFADSFNNVVWQMRPGEEPRTFVRGRSGGLRVDDQGNVYGIHVRGRNDSVLWRARPDGSVTDVATTTSSDSRVLNRLRALAGRPRLQLGPDRSIQRVGLDGRITTVATDVRLLDAGGGVLRRIFGSRPHLTGMDEDERGVIYVANAARRMIVRITPDGNAETVYTLDAGWTPAGVVAVGGSVFVLEHGQGVRVRRIAGTGGDIVAAVPARNGGVAAFGMPSFFGPVLH
jgi:sugar lactone lactonase YvrE